MKRIAAIAVILLVYNKTKRKRENKDESKQLVTSEQLDADKQLFTGGGTFSKEAASILRILFPSFNCKAMRYLVAHMMLLMLRTYLSLIVAELDGRLVRHLMSANGTGFAKGLAEWLLLAVPASYTNALIKYFEQKIALHFRETLVNYTHSLYMGDKMEYYKLGCLDGELQNVDHYITSDIARFCNAAARLYSSLGKPVLDLGIFSWKLSRSLGGKATFGIFCNYFVTAALLRSLSPQFGKLAARESRLEGEYRNAHSKIVTNAEEIAFYDGGKIEKMRLNEIYMKLKTHIAKQVRKKAWYAILENYVLKYSWSASGFLFAAIPVFFPDLIRGRLISPSKKHREQENMGTFITNKRIMLSVSDAGGRIMYSIKDLAELASHTRRVFQLIAALHRVRSGEFSNIKALTGKDKEYTMADVKGAIEISDEKDSLSFNKVPVVVPGNGFDMSYGELLLNPLSFKVNENEHLLIVGSNGTGKSSIARLAAGMWPVYRGLLERSKSISFLPQRPYFSMGTLREQIIYPHTTPIVSDDELLNLLERVHLSYLPNREGGLDSIKEWKDVLSGGEKQRLMFARILYVKPKFVVIDEATSAVSADMEGQLYEECKKDGITLITITHRISLLKYHSAKLEVGLGDDGSMWTFESASKKGWQSLDTEITQLEAFLKDVPKLKARRQEIVNELA